MADKLRIVVVEPNNGGGLVHFAYQMCGALSEQGLDVTLLVGTDYELSDRPHNFRVEKILKLWQAFDPASMKLDRKSFMQRVFGKAWRQLRRVVRAMRLVLAWMKIVSYVFRTKPDIVQFTRIEHPIEMLFIAYLRSLGFVLTQICHEFQSREANNFLASFIANLNGNVYQYFSAIFFLSEKLREQFLSLYPAIPPAKTHTIPHGNSDWLLSLPSTPTADLQKKLGLTDTERVVLFFGLLSPSKGLEDLFEAFALVQKEVAVRLVVAGYPTKHVSMERFLARNHELGISEHVIFDPRYIPLGDIRPLMEVASLVVYPYRSGTQSGALQTAYTFGRPVIATSVGGLAEVVEDGKSGFIVSPQSPHELAQRIAQLVRNSAQADEFGRYARHLAETRFSWKTVAELMLPVFDEAVKTDTY
jgi:glycosyltransferase involved in cell wall biosynthesis